MKNFKLPENVTRAFGKTMLKMKKYSPEILMVVGVVTFGATVVTACRATTKASKIVDETKETLDVIHEVSDDPEKAEEYSKEDATKDLTIAYTQAGIKLAKVYTPTIVLGVVSIACFTSSHQILKKRNAALVAAYKTVDAGFKKYRENVVERFGKDVDRELKYDIKAKQFEKSTTDENGKERTENVIVDCPTSTLASPYARIFDSTCVLWEEDPEYNLMFLKRVERFMNDKLIAQGYLFLNDVYDALGMPRSKAGQIVGWIYDSKNPVGDNYVDFGIYNTDSEATRRFVNGYENCILLDFNVDGDILDLI